MSDAIASYKPYILTGSILSSLAGVTCIIYNKLKNPTLNFQTKKYVKDEQGEVTRRITSEFSGKIRSKIFATYKYTLLSALITGFIWYKRVFKPNYWAIWETPSAPICMDLWVSFDFILVLLTGYQNYKRNFTLKHILWALSSINLGLLLDFWNIPDDKFKLLLYPISCFHGILATLGIAAMSITCDKMVKDGLVELGVVSGLLNGLALSHKYFHPMDNVPNLQFYVAALMAFYVYFYSTKVVLVHAKKIHDDDEDEEDFDPIYHQLFLMLPVHLYAMFGGFYTAQNLRDAFKLLKSRRVKL